MKSNNALACVLYAQALANESGRRVYIVALNGTLSVRHRLCGRLLEIVHPITECR